MFNAAVIALILQCGISAGAVGIVIFTPTVGLGCRSVGYIVYTGVSVAIMLFTILSTIFVRISETRTGRITVIKGLTAFIAIALRRLCALLAILNAIGLLVVSCMQFANFFNNCYCNASVIGQGVNSYMIIFYDGWFHTMRIARIWGTVLAGISMAVYMIFLWLISALPANVDDF